jgi:hypothetical protein
LNRRHYDFKALKSSASRIQKASKSLIEGIDFQLDGSSPQRGSRKAS